MIALILALLLQGPPDERSFGDLIPLVPTTPLCVKSEETLGQITLLKSCREDSLLLYVNQGQADEITAKILYWRMDHPERLHAGFLRLTHAPSRDGLLLMSVKIPINPRRVIAIQITMKSQRKKIKQQTFVYPRVDDVTE